MEINEIQDSIHAQLALKNSVLSDFNEGSVLYTLTRSIAAAINEILLTVKEETKNNNILTATGSNLDLIGAQYNQTRKLGAKAVGNILATNLAGAISLPQGTVLVNPINGNTYQTTIDVNLSSNLETRISVVSEEIGADKNLNGGAYLISSVYPNVIFTVGDFRTATGKYCGQIAGGLDDQSDSDFRSTIINNMYLPKVGTNSILLNTLLANPFVKKAWVQMVFPSVSTFWVDSNLTLTESQLNELYNTLLPLAPAGLLFNVAQVSITLITLHITFNSPVTNDIINNIKSIIETYLDNIATVQPFSILDLTNYIKSFLDFEFSIKLTSDIPLFSFNTILQLNDLTVTYNT